MQTRILDLDASVARQRGLAERWRATVLPFRDWGPRLRLACSFGAYRRFERELAGALGSFCDTGPCATFVGSGDFHHVSLALLRRQPARCNLLVLDKHPDWMCGVPLLHCGTWLRHAARLPQVGRVFHVGGELDFDNAYRWLAPWPELRSGKIVVLPALRRFRGYRWGGVPHDCLRQRPDQPVRRSWVEDWLGPFREELASCPLYVSLDKDVLCADEAVVNWDSGWLTTPEVVEVLDAFLAASAGLAGLDMVGDWSPVRARGPLRRALHWAEHPHLDVDAERAQRRNEELNLEVLQAVAARLAQGTKAGWAPRPQQRLAA
jgi:hypothetical protein